MEDRRENQASLDFMAHQNTIMDESKRRFVNMREALLDVIVELDREHNQKFAKRLKKRILESRSEEELRIIMDGMLVLAGFVIRPQV